MEKSIIVQIEALIGWPQERSLKTSYTHVNMQLFLDSMEKESSARATYYLISKKKATKRAVLNFDPHAAIELYTCTCNFLNIVY